MILCKISVTNSIMILFGNYAYYYLQYFNTPRHQYVEDGGQEGCKESYVFITIVVKCHAAGQRLDNSR